MQQRRQAGLITLPAKPTTSHLECDRDVHLVEPPSKTRRAVRTPRPNHAAQNSGRACRAIDPPLTSINLRFASRAMARLGAIATWLLVAVWLPATLHCDFGAVGFETLFHCESDHHSDSAKTDSEDSCDLVENGWIKLSGAYVPLAAPSLSVAFLCASPPLPAGPPTSPPGALSEDIVAPPEIARTWQFCVRAALPARAPDSIA